MAFATAIWIATMKNPTVLVIAFALTRLDGALPAGEQHQVVFLCNHAELLLFNTHLMQKSLFPLCAVMLVGSSAAKAQQQTESQVWRNIALADKALQSSHIKWEITVVTPGSTKVDVAKYVAETEALARQQGKSEEQVKSLSEWARNYAPQMKAGFTQHGDGEFLYNSKSTLANVGWGPVDGSKEAKPLGRSIDFYDGLNVITLKGTGDGVPKMGVLRRDGLPGLRSSANLFARPQLLIGHPVREIFNPSDTNIVDNKADTVTLEKTLKSPQDATPRAGGGLEGLVVRATISKSHWRLMSIDFWSPFSKRTMFRLSASGYQRSPLGVWFPSEVTSVSIPEPQSSEIYRLKSASFNAQVDTRPLDRPLPIGASMNDFRFSPRPGVSYVIRKGGVPGDATILKMVEEREQAEQSNVRHAQLTTVRNIALPIGALLLVGGLVWWCRSRQT